MQRRQKKRRLEQDVEHDGNTAPVTPERCTAPATQTNDLDLAASVAELSLLETPKRPGLRSLIEGSQNASAVGVKKVLFDEESSGSSELKLEPAAGSWSSEETAAGLIQFILMSTDGKSWSFRKRIYFWNKAATFVQSYAKTSHCRSGEIVWYLSSLFVNNNHISYRNCLSIKGFKISIIKVCFPTGSRKALHEIYTSCC